MELTDETVDPAIWGKNFPLQYDSGAHAPQEAARILGEAIDYLRQGQLALRPSPQ